MWGQTEPLIQSHILGLDLRTPLMEPPSNLCPQSGRISISVKVRRFSCSSSRIYYLIDQHQSSALEDGVGESVSLGPLVSEFPVAVEADKRLPLITHHQYSTRMTLVIALSSILPGLRKSQGSLCGHHPLFPVSSLLFCLLPMRVNMLKIFTCQKVYNTLSTV